MKAVLVIDMPDDCPVCPMAHWNKLDEFTGCDAVSGKKYAINDKEYAESSNRPSWCPLKQMPSKKETDIETDLSSGDDYISGYKDGYNRGVDAGWNRCLEEIRK